VARYEQTQNIDEPLAMLRSAATSYYHADGLGSITSLSSSAGSIANTYTYDSFGKLTASTGSLVNPFRYTARESDTETALYYYRARYYDLQTGRFLAEDPLQFAGGGTDFYAYSFNNSANLSDPTGLAPGLLDRLLDWWKPTSPPPTPCAPKFNCDADGYRSATPFESSQALALAAAFRGTPYGGKGPDSFDCSGLICWAIHHTVNGNFPDQNTGGMHGQQPGLVPLGPGQSPGAGDIVLFPGHVGFYDPNPPRPDNNLLSARGSYSHPENSVGVEWAPIRGWLPATPTYLRLRVPCNR